MLCRETGYWRRTSTWKRTTLKRCPMDPTNSEPPPRGPPRYLAACDGVGHRRQQSSRRPCYPKTVGAVRCGFVRNPSAVVLGYHGQGRLAVLPAVFEAPTLRVAMSVGYGYSAFVPAFSPPDYNLCLFKKSFVTVMSYVGGLRSSRILWVLGLFSSSVFLFIATAGTEPCPTTSRPRPTRNLRMSQVGIPPPSHRQTEGRKTRLRSHPHISTIADKPRDFLHARVSLCRGGKLSEETTDQLPRRLHKNQSLPVSQPSLQEKVVLRPPPPGQRSTPPRYTDASRGSSSGNL